MKKALVFGITGQDGSYLAELLLKKGYEVHGFVRRSSVGNFERIGHLLEEKHLTLHQGNLLDSGSIQRVISKTRPDEIYNLAAQSHVKTSFEVPEYTAEATALGALRILEAIRSTGLKTKFYQASSSEMFGKVKENPQSEETPFYPRSPYGVSKVFAFWITKNYRESYGIFASNGILFNHESPRRGDNFVTRKISKGVARIKMGLQEELVLGNLEAKRDWGHAREFVEAMWLMLQKEEPGDFVISTGSTHSVREFLEKTLDAAGIKYKKEGTGLSEVYKDETEKVIVRVSKRFFRPSEVDLLLGDSSKAKREFGWSAKTGFEALVKEMFDSEIEIAKKELFGINGQRPQ
jgi:GDPmannose 4,6-dehydratase